MSRENKGVPGAVVTNEEMRNLGRARGRQSTGKFTVHSRDFRQAPEYKSISSSCLHFGNGSHGDNGC